MEKRLNIPAKQIKLFTDQALKKELKGRDADNLTKIGLKNGDMLHIGNQTVELTSVKTKIAEIEKKKEENEKMIDTNKEEEKKKEEEKEKEK